MRDIHLTDWNSGQICLNFYCWIKNRFLHIKCKEHSIDCTSTLMFVLSILEILRLSTGMLLNCKQCYKNVNEDCLHFNICQLSILTFKMVFVTLMLALMKVYFSVLFAQWPIWMPTSVIECWLKCINRNWIWFMRKCSYFRANECIFALLVAVSRKWLRIFS